MKFTAAVVAICAATASAFSVTMSSTGYLSNLGSGGGLTSFAPAAGAPAPSYSYAPAPAPAQPASYSAPAPAPAPATYSSGFADLPASSALNYIGGLGGGNSMKPGKNYSGVSQSFSPTNTGPSYLSNLGGGATMQSTYNAPAAAEPAYQSSFAQPAAPAPAPYQSSFASAPAPAPYQSSFAQAPAPAPAAAAPVNTGSYLENLGGGSSMPSGGVSKSYSGMASSFSRATTGQMAGATSGYLSNL